MRRTDRNLKSYDKEHDAFKQWDGDKRKAAAKFWADAFAGKLNGSGGSIVWPKPIQPASVFVARRYKALGKPLDGYLPFPHLRAEDGAEGTVA
jgi:hypothetical protein